ncbi:MAG TPA: GNAT family N-acetyltransferase [Candidatus Limnocylindrales bacterium]|nr:GNAT family N-acetyltransferase [Candidatus Limnocylindrales bacterium]
MTHDAGLLRDIDAYLDAVPRSATAPEDLGPFTIFRSLAPWPYYARPRIGFEGGIEAEDVLTLRAAQRERGTTETIEWVHEIAPSMAESAVAAGLQVAAYPLMSLRPADFAPTAPPDGVEVRLLGDDDESFDAAHAVADVGFRFGGTAVGNEGCDARDAAVGATPDAIAEYRRVRAHEGWTISAAAFAVEGPIAVGSHQPIGRATEIVGVATLPTWRRKGLGAAVTTMLVADALVRGVEMIFLSAGSEDVARVYARLGFRRVGTAGAAEPPPRPPETAA